MKHRLIAFILCIALAACLFSGLAAPKIKLTIANDTSWAFNELYLTPSDSDSWGSNLFADISSLEPEEYIEASLEASDYYDLEAVDEDGDFWTFMDIPLENDCIIYLAETDTDILLDIELPDGSTTEIVGLFTLSDGEESQPDEAQADDQEEQTPQEEQPPGPGFYNVQPEMIEEQSRVNNHACVAIYGGWRYGSVLSSHKNCFVRENATDGTGGVILDDRGYAASILILDDNTMFYYLVSKSGNEDGLYMSATDGSNRIQLASRQINCMQLYGKKLYFTGEATDNRLMRYDPATGKSVTAIDKSAFYTYIYGDKKMYQDDADGETLHVCDTDGSNDAKITDTQTYSPVFDGEFIYYVNGADAKTIYRIAADGSAKQKLGEVPASGIVLSGDSVFFRGVDDNKLYCMNKDGSNARVFSTDAVLQSNPCLLDGTIYFFQADSKGLYYVNMADGSIDPAMATPAPKAPESTSNKTDYYEHGDAYEDYYYYSDEGYGDHYYGDGYGDYFYDEGYGDYFYY